MTREEAGRLSRLLRQGPISDFEARVVTVRAAAKINLHLGVGAPRGDGFHPLDTIYLAVSLYDDVTVLPRRAYSLLVESAGTVDVTSVPVDDSNLAAVAAKALAVFHGRRRTGGIEIAKGIPVAGGMAGGSADAAAVLVALDRLWDLQTPDDDLLAIAAEIGSDVPFALVGGVGHGSGRGEQVEALPVSATFWWVVVPSAEGLSTPAVYRRFDELHPDQPAEPTSSRALRGWLSGAADQPDPGELAALLHNDLQPAALDLRPDLEDLLRLGTDAGALQGLVSGSGPTCVFLCADRGAAEAVAGELSGAGRPVMIAHGPVAGAHLVSYD